MQEEYERAVEYKKGSGNVGGVEQLNIKRIRECRRSRTVEYKKGSGNVGGV